MCRVRKADDFLRRPSRAMSADAAGQHRWPTVKDAASGMPQPAGTDAGRPVFCAEAELTAIHCLRDQGRNNPVCLDLVSVFKDCIERQKENVKAGIIDCSNLHSASLRCLEENGYDKQACSEAFSAYKQCSSQRQASIRWQRKLGNIK